MNKRIPCIIFLLSMLWLSSCKSFRNSQDMVFESVPNLSVAQEIELPKGSRRVIAASMLGSEIYLVTASGNGATMLARVSLDTGEAETCEAMLDTGIETVLLPCLGELRLISGNVMWTVGKKDLSLSAQTDLTDLLSGASVLSARTDAEGKYYFVSNDRVLVADGDLSLNSEFTTTTKRYRSLALTGNGDVYAGFLAFQDNSFRLQVLGSTNDISAAGSVIDGDNTFDLYINDGESLIGLDLEKNTRTALLNWISNGIIPANIIDVLPLGDLSFAVVTSDKILLIEKAGEISEIPKTRTELVLACVSCNTKLYEAVAKFNSENENYYITINDYYDASLPDGIAVGRDRLNVEITAGKIPDIFYMFGISNEPIDAYASQGLLTDLYSFLDTDPELSRDDFFESILTACERNGKLQILPAAFSVEMLGGRASVIGSEGMTIEDIITFVTENAADLSEKVNFTNATFLRLVVEYGGDSLIDWESGKCYFDGQEFIKILEAAKLCGYDKFGSSNPPPQRL